MKNFEEFVSLWKSESKDIKIKNPKDADGNHPKIKNRNLLFLVVYPDKLEWNFAVEKQTQTTTFMLSGGFTGASIGHDIQFCYRSEVNDYLENCKHTHAMIVSVGMVFDMVGGVSPEAAKLRKWRNDDDDHVYNPYSGEDRLTPITDFYDFIESNEYCKAHIMAKPDKPAYLHHQHINLNVKKWKSIGCPPLNERWEEYERDGRNFHDDYTPYWIKPKDRPKIINFNHHERTRKSFSYYRDSQDAAWKDLENVDRNEFYFSRFMTRIKPSFYLYNTESFKVLPGLHRPWDTFDLLFCPTAGYKAELLVDKLNFKGEVIFYDYTQENIDAKKSIVDMNMSLDEIYNYGGLVHSNIVDNVFNKPAAERAAAMGTHEELRALQEKMSREQEVDYWLMDIINPDYNKLKEKLAGHQVFFDTSNIFSYHMSHAYYTLGELVNSYNKLHQTLSEASNYCWFQGTRPTKQWDRRWIS